jgi:hypothetical protein
MRVDDPELLAEDPQDRVHGVHAKCALASFELNDEPEAHSGERCELRLSESTGSSPLANE